MLWPSVALVACLATSPNAEESTAPDRAGPVPASTPAAPSSAAQKGARAEVLKKLAQLLDPREYGTAVISGAQAEYVGPSAGVSSMVLGYDAVAVQVEASVGFVFGDDPLQNAESAAAYNVALRLAVPVHRGLRADYALLVGGGAIFIDPPDEKAHAIGLAVTGARFRVFMTPNVATVATLGLAAVFRKDRATVFLGARPLGSAGVVYFFR